MVGKALAENPTRNNSTRFFRSWNRGSRGIGVTRFCSRGSRNFNRSLRNRSSSRHGSSRNIDGSGNSNSRTRRRSSNSRTNCGNGRSGHHGRTCKSRKSNRSGSTRNFRIGGTGTRIFFNVHRVIGTRHRKRRAPSL